MENAFCETSEVCDKKTSEVSAGLLKWRMPSVKPRRSAVSSVFICGSARIRNHKNRQNQKYSNESAETI